MFLCCLAACYNFKDCYPNINAGLTVINQNYIHDEINSRLHSRKDCCYHTILESCTLLFTTVVTTVLYINMKPEPSVKRKNIERVPGNKAELE